MTRRKNSQRAHYLIVWWPRDDALDPEDCRVVWCCNVGTDRIVQGSNAILFGGLVCSMKLVDEYPPDGRMSSRYHTRVGNKSN